MKVSISRRASLLSDVRGIVVVHCGGDVMHMIYQKNLLFCKNLG